MAYSNINFDFNREQINGISEVILAEPKSNEQLNLVLEQCMEKLDTVLITRVKTSQIDTIQDYISSNGYFFVKDKLNRTFIIYKKNIKVMEKESQVAILSAGTSDQYIVEEVVLSLRFFGINCEIYSDIGIAGIRRHQEVLEKLHSNRTIKILIVVAGQEGAIFPVITAQTKLPVIAVPSEVGYGFGGKGKAALYSALQSCSPGIVTLNIGNGFGAAAFAYKTLKAFE